MSTSQRRLAAVVVTDVVGFSAKAQRDEESALALLRRHADIVGGLVATHGGRIVKSLGDGYLIEFGSALDAVRCSFEIQEAIEAQNALEPDEARRFHLRIGIHLGDIEFVDEDILGDGVNIASRLHHLAEPGGICVSEDVYRQVAGRRNFAFRTMGTPPLKNIERPIELYRLVMGPRPAAPAAKAPEGLTSIAVLPFQNFSSDPENEHFCDGLADELINALTRVRKLRVVSRTSSFAFRSKEHPMREVGEILGVEVVVEGSVRKAGDHIRVTVQVIDVASDSHLWSEQYDRELKDIFAIQAELTGAIVAALEVAVTPEEREALARSGTSNVDAYELYLQGIQQYWRFSIPGLRAARSLFREAISLDPSFAQAYSALAQCAAYHFFFWGDKAMLDDARWAAETLLRLDPASAQTSLSRGLAYLLAGDFDEAHAQFVEATRRDPQSYDAWYALGRCRFASGSFAGAIEAYERAATIRVDDFQCLCLAQVACRSAGDEDRRRDLAERVLPVLLRHRRLHPDDPRAAYFEASVRTVLGDNAAAMPCLEQAIALGPNDPTILYNAACVYCLLGMREEALDCLARTAKSGFVDHDWMRHDMDLREVQDDPRFAEVIRMVEENRRNALNNVQVA